MLIILIHLVCVCVCWQEFDLCAQWVQLYPVSEQSKLQLQTEHLLHLLENGLTEDAFQVRQRAQTF